MVNNRSASAGQLTARATLFNTDGTQKYDRKVTGVQVSGGGAHSTALTLPASVPGLSTTYLLRLTLTDARPARRLAGTMYWLSAKPDTLDWAHTDWY
ncbi:hypothetical protein ACRAWF_02745 [Streptomyces sp. L7]